MEIFNGFCTYLIVGIGVSLVMARTAMAKKTVVLFYVENQNAEQNIENNRDKDCTTGELVPVILVKQAATRVFWFCLVYNILTLST